MIPQAMTHDHDTAQTDAANERENRERISAIVKRMRHHNANGNSALDFFVSLCEQFDRRGTLSRRQVETGERLMDDIDRRYSAIPIQAEPKGPALFLPIVETFRSAAKNLKWPKIRLRTATGHPVVLSLYGPRSNTPGAINITDGRRYGENIYYGKISRKGRLKSSPPMTDEIINLMVEFAANPSNIAKMQGQRFGACCFCGKQLTHASSLHAGYGPTCASNYCLPWGETSNG